MRIFWENMMFTIEPENIKVSVIVIELRYRFIDPPRQFLRPISTIMSKVESLLYRGMHISSGMSQATNFRGPWPPSSVQGSLIRMAKCGSETHHSPKETYDPTLYFTTGSIARLPDLSSAAIGSAISIILTDTQMILLSK